MRTKEPLATRTLAAIYEQQGKPERAKALLATIGAAENNTANANASKHRPRRKQSATADVDTICVERHGATLQVQWQINAATLNKAWQVHDISAAKTLLTVRLICFAADDEIVTDYATKQLSGETTFPLTDGTLFAAVSVGFALPGKNGRFFSVIHHEPVAVQPA